MPTRPPSRCTEPGCPELVTTPGPCPDHARQRDRTLKARQPWRAYKGVWPKVRAQVLREEPYCRACGAPASEVDHVVPLERGGPRLARTNLQALCRPCHNAKTTAETGRGGDPSAR